MEAVNYIFGKWLRRHLLLPRRLQSSWVIKYSINFQLTFFLFSLRELLLGDPESIESRKPKVQVTEGLKWKKACQGWRERRKRWRFEGERIKGFKRTNGKMEGGRRSRSNGKQWEERGLSGASVRPYVSQRSQWSSKLSSAKSWQQEGQWTELGNCSQQGFKTGVSQMFPWEGQDQTEGTDRAFLKKLWIRASNQANFCPRRSFKYICILSNSLSGFQYAKQ